MSDFKGRKELLCPSLGYILVTFGAALQGILPFDRDHPVKGDLAGMENALPPAVIHAKFERGRHPLAGH